MNIGVFDSGLGGLTILKSMLGSMPGYHYVYLGDNARVPYGNRSPELIYQFTREAVDFLISKGCGIVVVACNTATATALRRIQNEHLPANHPGKRVLGIIRPVAEKVASEKVRKGKVAVLATKATVKSGAFEREIKKLNPAIEVIQQACPLLVPFIEEGGEGLDAALDLILREYLGPIMKEEPGTIILACTHYALIADRIQRIAGPGVKVMQEGPVVAASLENYLERHAELEAGLAKDAKVDYFVTDINPEYEKLIPLFIGKSWNGGKINVVSINDSAII